MSQNDVINLQVHMDPCLKRLLFFCAASTGEPHFEEGVPSTAHTEHVQSRIIKVMTNTCAEALGNDHEMVCATSSSAKAHGAAAGDATV